MFTSLIVAILVLVRGGYCQNPSPCPKVFSYEPRGQETDRWFGVIALTTTEELHGVWLRVVLDRPAELLGNWFGEAVSSDNKEYTIKNPSYKLEVGQAVTVRFFVKYNEASTIPSLTSIRLNGKVVCGSTNAPKGTSQPPLHISQIRPTSPPGPTEGSVGINRRPTQETKPRPAERPSRPSSNTGLSRPQSSSSGEEAALSSSSSLSGGLDHFQGDFTIRRPVPGSSPSTLPQATLNRSPACGTVTMRAKPLVSHGQATTQGQWPWHTALYYAEHVQLMYICGGTLVSDQHVLTAAHCVAKPQSNRPINTSNLLIHLGKYTLNKFSQGVQERDVSDIFIHPQYNYSLYFNDIAVLKLDTPVEITNYVRPCCLWEDSTDLSSVLDKYGTVVGWGFDHNLEISNALMQAQMPVVTNVKCIYSNREFFSQFLFENNYCAGFRNGTSVCNGDSGGGMVFPKSDSRGSNTVWQIRGLVSIGVALQDQRVCDTSHYVVFTDVAQHLEWIKQTMRQ